MCRFHINYFKNVKKKRWQSIFQPSSIRHHRYQRSALRGSITWNCTARCNFNMREGPAPWYARLLHHYLCALLKSFALLPESSRAAGPSVARSPAPRIVRTAPVIRLVTWTPRSSRSLGRPFSCTKNWTHCSSHSDDTKIPCRRNWAYICFTCFQVPCSLRLVFPE